MSKISVKMLISLGVLIRIWTTIKKQNSICYTTNEVHRRSNIGYTNHILLALNLKC